MCVSQVSICSAAFTISQRTYCFHSSIFSFMLFASSFASSAFVMPANAVCLSGNPHQVFLFFIFCCPLGALKIVIFEWKCFRLYFVIVALYAENISVAHLKNPAPCCPYICAPLFNKVSETHTHTHTCFGDPNLCYKILLLLLFFFPIFVFGHLQYARHLMELYVALDPSVPPPNYITPPLHLLILGLFAKWCQTDMHVDLICTFA